MKKLLLVFAASVFVAATNVNAQSVKAYRGSTATDYAINELEYGTINNADSIVVTGTLNTEQAYKLRESLKGSFISASFQLIGNFNDQLIKADFSNAEFTTNNLDSMFFYFHNLTQVIFPNKENSIAISMKDIFNNCSLLKSIENLDKFSNITNLAYAFYQCYGLTSVTFSSVANNNSINFSYAFYQGASLVGVYNLDKFNNISGLKAMFYNCNKLDSIAFSNTANNNAIDAAGCFNSCSSLRKIVNFEKFTNVTDITGTFSSCDKLGIIRLGNVPAKYDNAFPRTYVIFLPDGVTDYPDKYSWYSAVLLPVTSVTASGVASYVEGGAMALPTVTFEPENDYLSSSYYTYKYEISNNSFSTFEEYVPNTAVTKDYTGYKMRVGVKNARMDTYIYSSAVDIQKLVYALTAYRGSVATKYAISQIGTGTLANADSVVLHGALSDDNMLVLQKSLKTSWQSGTGDDDSTNPYNNTTNNNLKAFDMSNATFSEDISNGMYAFFRNCTALKRVDFPKKSFSEKVTLRWAFMGCTSLETINNLDKIQNYLSINRTFKDCKNLKSVSFSEGNSIRESTSYSFSWTFCNCKKLEEILNFETFTKCHFCQGTFMDCSSLKEVHIGFDPNPLYAEHDYETKDAFTNCNAIKYLPSDIKKIPSNWQSYTNFVLPITSVTVEGAASIEETGGKMMLPECTIEPKFCYLSDTVYVISNDNFATSTSHSLNDILTGNYTGYKLKIGVKNASMADYAYSSAIDVIKINYVLTAYTGGVAQKYSIEQLETGTLAQADSIMVYGSWNDSNLSKLQKALKTDVSTSIHNNSLKKADMSETTFIGNIISGMDNMYRNCDSLKNVVLPSSVFTGQISLDYTFYGCNKLVDIKNLDKLSNITDLDETFYNCKKLGNVKFAEAENTNVISLIETFYYCYSLESVDLSSFKNISSSLFRTFNYCISLESVKFADAENSNSIRLDETFYGCTALQTLTNFEKFTNLYDFGYAFSGCKSLKEVKLGTDPNTDNAKKTYWSSDTPFINAFTDCNAIKYLPDTVKTIPSIWQSYTNFVLPITSIEIFGTATIDKQGGKITAPSINCTPKYCVGTDTVYLLSNDNFKTNKTVKPGDDIPASYFGYQIKVGAKNERMSNYVYSTNNAQIGKAPLAKAYANGVSTEYGISDLATGTLATADSIVLSGVWNDTQIAAFRMSLKSNGEPSTTNSTLKKADLSDVTLSGGFTSGMEYLFCKCQNLVSVALPSTETAGKVSLYNAFYNCSSLESIANLDKLTNIIDMYMAFQYCSNLESLTFASTENSNSVNMRDAFYNCNALKNIDVSSFTNITNLESSFESCDNLESVKFSDKANGNSIDFYETFYECPKLAAIENLDKFTNLYDFRETFSGCQSLNTIKLGTDPNTENAKKLSGWHSTNEDFNHPFYQTFDNCNALVYLPESVTTVPDNWQGYTNFVLPFTAIEPSGIAAFDAKTGLIYLPAISYTPSYCVGTDFVYQLSNNNFSTYTTYSPAEVLTGNYVGYKIRVGAKNERMSNYVYSTNNAQIGKAPLAKAYANGVSTEYGISELATGTLATADSVVLSGIWTDAQIAAFRMSLKSDGNPSTTNSTLKKADLSDMVLSGDIIMKELFDYCKALVSVAMPSTETVGTVSLNSAFEECTSLESVANLDKFINLTSLFETFNNCSKLKSLTFASNQNGNEVSMEKIFYNCSSLESLTNFDKFTNIVNLRYAFSSCKNLKEIHIGGIKSSNFADKYYTPSSFDNCNAIKYLPEDITTIPDNWKSYKNFVLPFTAIEPSGIATIDSKTGLISLPAISYTPSYCVGTDFTYQLSNNNFSTYTTHSAADVLTGNYNGYQVRVGAKNERMNNYVYSTNSLQIGKTPLAKAYANGVSTEYGVSDLATGTLATADSVVLSGVWNDTQIAAFRMSLKSDGEPSTTNSTLKKADLSDVTLSGNITSGMEYLFRNCQNLVSVALPSTETAGTVSLDNAFYSCSSLESIANLDKLTNIIDMYMAFQYCSNLESLTFASTENSNSVNMRDAFYNCNALKNIDVSSFTNITNLESSFESCDNLESVKFSDKANGNSIDFYETFYECPKLAAIENLDKFTNLYDFRETFSGCQSLNTIKLGTDPNTENAKKLSGWYSPTEDFFNHPFYQTFDNCNALVYLPESVTTVPDNWKSYKNFVLPITSVTQSGYATILETGGIMELPTFTIQPAYCVATDVVYQLSNNNFITSKTCSANEVLNGNYVGYNLRIGVKNPSMTDYVYSTSASEVKKGYLLIAYNGEDSTIFDSNSLTAGSLTGYDRIVMSSIWDNTNLQKLQKALKNGDSNTTLATVDASEAKFDNNSKFDHLFENCTSLIEIKLPSANTGSISLTSAFAGCTSLKFVINLDKLSGICSLDSAFAQCSSLSTLTFCSTTNTNSIDATAAFAGCSKLSYANNFKAFANITSLKATFKDCSNLSNSITLGVDPNKLDAQKLVGTFDGTNQYCDKYLPNGVETIPAVWENAGYTRFVVPIKSVTAQISAFTDEDGTASVSVDSYTVEPAYAYYYTNTIYSNDDFATTVSSSDLLPGFKVKVGVSNNAMSNYVYSDPVTATTITSSITAYRGKAKSIYKTSELQTGLLADADSIILSGTWHNNNLSKLKNAIKESTYSTNSSLKKFDMSGAKFLGVISSINAMFYSCSSLEKVILPPTEFTSKISLYEIFDGCSKLTEIVNLDKLSNITSLNYAFCDCYLLQNVKFSDKTNNNEISLYYAFCDCNAMKNIDVSSFANIYDLERSFESCDNLESVKFSDKANGNSIDFYETFYECPKLAAIENLDKFTNLYDFRETFSGCQSLNTIKLGTDPNTENAKKLSGWHSTNEDFNHPFYQTFDNCNALVYLPEGVTTVPDNWKNYKNFVLPITSAKATGPAVIDGNSQKVTLPSFTCEPSFAVVQDTIYQISNDNFKTSKTLNANDLLNGNITDYKVRIGIKNNSMADFIFSDTVEISNLGCLLAYKNGKMSKYSAADLTTGLLANADSVVLSGAWNDAQIAAFRMSLKSNGEPSTTNSTLKKADLSDVTLSGDIIMKELFDYCKALVYVAMPSTETAGTVSLNSAFEECTSLERVANLDKFINLTSLFETFNNCPKLKSVSLASTTNSNEVSMEKTFYNCSSLDSIANLEKLTNVVNLRYTFSNCEKLKVIHIGGIKSSNFADKYYTPYTFDNCNAIKYLPEDITTIPGNWKNYNNFVLPIDSVRISGSLYILKPTNKLTLPDMACFQSYVAATDVKWQFSNDNFATAIDYNENANIDFTKYSIRCAAKNDAMSDYVYSNTLSGIKEVYAIVTAYTSTVQKTYSVTELTTGLLANADSIVMDGLWSDNDILALQKSLKTSWSGDVSDAYNMNETTNNKLKKANMSSIAFSEDINQGFVCLFRNCKELTRVIFPEKKFTQGLNLDYAFRNCTKLIAVDNLINADSLISLESIFIYCYDLDSVSFSPELKYKPYDLRYSFYYCYKLRCVDNFESFVNVSNLRSTFESCENLKEIHLGFDPNVLYEDYYENVQYTFYDCPALKYLPEGVTTIPESWEWYSNFVVPFSMYIDVNYSNKLLSLSMPAANPSYAAITDVVWKISDNNFETYDTYSVTGKLDAARTNISSDYEIYSHPLSGDYGGYQLICEAYNPLYSAKTKFEIHYSGWVEEVDIKDTKCDIFALYPNPATTSFQINVGEQQVQMSIFNSIGNMIKTQTVFGLTQVDISDMQQGIYYVKVGSQVVKLIKQ